MKKTEAEQIAIYRQQAAIIGTLRATIPTVQHYTTFGKLVEKKLQAALHEHHVRCSIEYGQFKINVWGCNISWEDSVSLSWGMHDGANWAHGIEEALNRSDPSDTLERYEAEESILHDLRRLDVEIALRKERAAILIESLPIPATAIKTGMRTDQCHWTDLSHIRRERFPNLFPKR